MANGHKESYFIAAKFKSLKNTCEQTNSSRLSDMMHRQSKVIWVSRVHQSLKLPRFLGFPRNKSDAVHSYYHPTKPVINTGYRNFFGASRLSTIPLLLLLSSHLSQPASAKSSSTTKSLIRSILDPLISSPHSIHPLLLNQVVTANHPTAESAPAALPTKTCLTVW